MLAKWVKIFHCLEKSLIAPNLWNVIKVKWHYNESEKLDHPFHHLFDKYWFSALIRSPWKNCQYLLSSHPLIHCNQTSVTVSWIQALSQSPMNSMLALWNTHRVDSNSPNTSISFRSLSKYSSSASLTPYLRKNFPPFILFSFCAFPHILIITWHNLHIDSLKWSKFLSPFWECKFNKDIDFVLFTVLPSALRKSPGYQ